MTDVCRITIGYPKHIGRDFLKHLDEIDWGDRLLICGTGPDVQLHLPRVPAVDYRIAVNGAIAIPGPVAGVHFWDGWAAMDTAVPGLDYAKEVPENVDIYLGTAIAERFDRCSYTFRTDVQCLGPCPRHIIRGDATIGGATLHMARRLFDTNCRPHTIYLCGIPMKGGYYNGKHSYQEQCAKDRGWPNWDGIDWSQTDAFNEIIADSLGAGMSIYHVGGTNLEVEQI